MNSSQLPTNYVIIFESHLRYYLHQIQEIKGEATNKTLSITDPNSIRENYRTELHLPKVVDFVTQYIKPVLHNQRKQVASDQ
jgi:hypothetical protein